jgi:hypothetical protein
MAMRTQEYIRPKGPLPDRILTQRMAALAKADEVRSYRSELKHNISTGISSIYDYLLDPPEMIWTMKLLDLMMAIPRYGSVRVNQILNVCRISPAQQIGDMSDYQRTEIVFMLRS